MVGPAFVIQRADHLVDGRVRVLVRYRGGRMVRLVVPAMLANGPDIEQLVVNVGALQPRKLPPNGKW